MIRSFRARLPPELGVGYSGAHLVPVAQVLWRGLGRYAGNADRMRQDVAHGRALFTVGPEIGPQLHNRGVVVEETALYEHVRHGRGRALADRVSVERRVRRYQTSGFGVSESGNGVDYLLAIPVDGDLQAPLGSRFDQLVDCSLDPLLKVFDHCCSFLRDFGHPCSGAYCLKPETRDLVWGQRPQATSALTRSRPIVSHELAPRMNRLVSVAPVIRQTSPRTASPEVRGTSTPMAPKSSNAPTMYRNHWPMPMVVNISTIAWSPPTLASPAITNWSASSTWSTQSAMFIPRLRVAAVADASVPVASIPL